MIHTVVLVIVDSIAVDVDCAICRTGGKALVEIRVADFVSAPWDAVRRTHQVSLCKTAYAIPAKPTIYRAFSRVLTALAQAVTAGSVAVFVATLLGFDKAAEVVTTVRAVLHAVDGIFAPVADAIAAGWHAVFGAD
jgi:hypothetical protein